MGHKTLIRLLILLGAIALIALILKFVGSSGVEKVSSGTARNKVFEDFPIGEVAQVRVKSVDGEVNLKKGKDAWVVVERADFRADSEALVKFIRSVWDLEVIQSPEVGASQFSRLGLLDPEKDKENTAVVVSFLGADGKDLSSLWLGKVYTRKENRPNPFGGGFSTTDAGRYVKPGGADEVFLVGETFEAVKSKAEEWLDDEFFEVRKLKSIAIETGDKAQDWKLTRTEENGDFTLEGSIEEGKELDSTKVSSMKNAFSSPRFEDVVVGEDAKKNAPDKTTFKIETFEGFSYTVKISEKINDSDYHLTFDVEGKFSEKRKAAEEESDEEKKKADEEFAKNLKELKDKLAKEKRLAGKVYKVRSYVADSIASKRSDILKEKAKEVKDESGKKEEPKQEEPKMESAAPAAQAEKAETKPAPEKKPEAAAPAPEKKPAAQAAPEKEAAKAPEAAMPAKQPETSTPTQPEAKTPDKPKAGPGAAKPAPAPETKPAAQAAPGKEAAKAPEAAMPAKQPEPLRRLSRKRKLPTSRRLTREPRNRRPPPRRNRRRKPPPGRRPRRLPKPPCPRNSREPLRRLSRKQKLPTSRRAIRHPRNRCLPLPKNRRAEFLSFAVIISPSCPVNDCRRSSPSLTKPSRPAPSSPIPTMERPQLSTGDPPAIFIAFESAKMHLAIHPDNADLPLHQVAGFDSTLGGWF